MQGNAEVGRNTVSYNQAIITAPHQPITTICLLMSYKKNPFRHLSFRKMITVTLSTKRIFKAKLTVQPNPVNMTL